MREKINRKSLLEYQNLEQPRTQAIYSALPHLLSLDLKRVGERRVKNLGTKLNLELLSIQLTFLLLPELLVLLPVLAPEGEVGFDSLVNLRPEVGDSRNIAVIKQKYISKKINDNIQLLKLLSV